jgi:predicted restriction endonuclease
LLKDFVDVPFFKLTSFRPWLVGSKNPVKDLEIGKLLTERNIYKIACYKDL